MRTYRYFSRVRLLHPMAAPRDRRRDVRRIDPQRQRHGEQDEADGQDQHRPPQAPQGDDGRPDALPADHGEAPPPDEPRDQQEHRERDDHQDGGEGGGLPESPNPALVEVGGDPGRQHVDPSRRSDEGGDAEGGDGGREDQ